MSTRGQGDHARRAPPAPDLCGAAPADLSARLSSDPL